MQQENILSLMLYSTSMSTKQPASEVFTEGHDALTHILTNILQICHHHFIA